MDRVLVTACVVLACVSACMWSGCAGGAKGPDAVLAVYEKSGGFAGMDSRLVVRDNGALVLEDRRTGVTTQVAADPARLKRLREVLRKPELAAVKSLYTKPDGADLMSYGIDATTPKGTRSISTFDAADHPAVVGELIEALDALWADARTAPKSR